MLTQRTIFNDKQTPNNSRAAKQTIIHLSTGFDTALVEAPMISPSTTAPQAYISVSLERNERTTLEFLLLTGNYEEFRKIFNQFTQRMDSVFFQKTFFEPISPHLNSSESLFSLGAGQEKRNDAINKKKMDLTQLKQQHVSLENIFQQIQRNPLLSSGHQTFPLLSAEFTKNITALNLIISDLVEEMNQEIEKHTQTTKMMRHLIIQNNFVAELNKAPHTLASLCLQFFLPTSLLRENFTNKYSASIWIEPGFYIPKSDDFVEVGAIRKKMFEIVKQKAIELGLNEAIEKILDLAKKMESVDQNILSTICSNMEQDSQSESGKETAIAPMNTVFMPVSMSPPSEYNPLLEARLLFYLCEKPTFNPLNQYLDTDPDLIEQNFCKKRLSLLNAIALSILSLFRDNKPVFMDITANFLFNTKSQKLSSEQKAFIESLFMIMENSAFLTAEKNCITLSHFTTCLPIFYHYIKVMYAVQLKVSSVQNSEIGNNSLSDEEFNNWIVLIAQKFCLHIKIIDEHTYDSNVPKTKEEQAKYQPPGFSSDDVAAKSSNLLAIMPNASTPGLMFFQANAGALVNSFKHRPTIVIEKIRLNGEEYYECYFPKTLINATDSQFNDKDLAQTKLNSKRQSLPSQEEYEKSKADQREKMKTDDNEKIGNNKPAKNTTYANVNPISNSWW